MKKPIKDRNDQSSAEKYQSFKKAFDIVSDYRKKGNYLAAYVVLFSIFEDRITASYILSKKLAGYDNIQKKRLPPLHGKIEHLEDRLYLTKTDADKWRNEGDLRNKLLHQAMWKVDVFGEEHCGNILNAANAANNLSKRLKTKVKKLEKENKPK
jgi:hypothetical protein